MFSDMIINWTDAFMALRSTRAEERELKRALTVEFVSKQPISPFCSLCPSRADRGSPLCTRCFLAIHPPQMDLQVSIVVEYARVLCGMTTGTGNEDCDGRLGFLGIPPGCTPEDLAGMAFSPEPAGLDGDEKRILASIRMRVQAQMAARWMAARVRSMVDLVDEQMCVIRLRYLLCLRSLRIDDALLLKRHMAEVREQRGRLIGILRGRS